MPDLRGGAAQGSAITKAYLQAVHFIFSLLIVVDEKIGHNLISNISYTENDTAGLAYW